MYETWQNFHQKSQIDKVLSILCAVFQVLFLNNSSILFQILNMWVQWKNWYQNTYLSISMRQFMKIICLLQSVRLTTTLGGLVMVRSKPSTKAAGSRILAYKHLWCHYSKWVLNNVIYTAICHTSRSLETTSRLIIWLYHSATVHSGFHKKLF